MHCNRWVKLAGALFMLLSLWTLAPERVSRLLGEEKQQLNLIHCLAPGEAKCFSLFLYWPEKQTWTNETRLNLTISRPTQTLPVARSFREPPAERAVKLSRLFQPELEPEPELAGDLPVFSIVHANERKVRHKKSFSLVHHLAMRPLQESLWKLYEFLELYFWRALFLFGFLS